jgi:glycosyltransferase involved in cell wall biosynthesis
MGAKSSFVPTISEITARYFAGIRRRVPAAMMFTGVDTEIFHPAAGAAKPDIRRRLGLSPDRPVVLFVGRFVEKKGLQILSQMARQRPDIQWAFAGWGHLDPQDWGLPNVIVFRGLSGPGLVPLYQMADVFVLPSKGEGFPLVIQEALACGLPVVCSAEICGADAAVSPLLFPVALDESDLNGTASAFCAEIDRRLANRAGDAGLAAERVQFVSRRYSWAACGAEYLELIRSAVHDSDPRRQRARDPRLESGRA